MRLNLSNKFSQIRLHMGRRGKNRVRVQFQFDLETQTARGEVLQQILFLVTLACCCCFRPKIYDLDGREIGERKLSAAEFRSANSRKRAMTEIRTR